MGRVYGKRGSFFKKKGLMLGKRSQLGKYVILGGGGGGEGAEHLD